MLRHEGICVVVVGMVFLSTVHDARGGGLWCQRAMFQQIEGNIKLECNLGLKSSWRRGLGSKAKGKVEEERMMREATEERRGEEEEDDERQNAWSGNGL